MSILKTIYLQHLNGANANMTLDSSGNIGVGNTSPQYRLDVTDNTTGQQLRLSSSHGNGTSMGFVSSSTNGRTWRVGSNYVDGLGEFAIYDATSSANRLNINSSGYATVPYQPSFMTTIASGSTMVAGTVVKFTTIQHNIGSHYSTSTGRFTAPIAGRYFFAYNGMGNDTANRIMLRLQLNGSDYIYGSTIATGYADVKGYAILNLSAGDYVNVIAITNYFWQNGNSAEHYFTGCLLY